MERKKKIFYSELCYVFGIIILAMGASIMERANFGLSMVVAPAYVIHLKVVNYLPFFTFGMSEYIFQGLLLIIMWIITRKFRPAHLFSFVTAVIYGLLLDGFMFLLDFLPDPGIAERIILYSVGVFMGALGVMFIFRTYIAAEVYELFVKEFSEAFKKDVGRVKLIYDLVSCLLAVVLSFAFFGLWKFEGVKWGTIICAVVTGPLITVMGKLFDRHFEVADKLKFRKIFEGKTGKEND